LRRPLLSLAALVLAVTALGASPALAAKPKPSPAATTPTRTVRADGVRLAYRAFGEGRPIVFIMGISGTMDAWDPRFLDAVARQGRRVIVFDNEGMGRSGVREGELTIRRMGDDAAALIRELGFRRADVFAWSMGGMIGQSLAVRHPRRVRRLILASTAPGDGKVTPPTQRGLDAIAGTNGAAVLSSYDLLFTPDAAAAGESYVENVLLRKSAKPVGSRETLLAQILASGHWLAGDDPDGRRVARLKMPVLIGGGAHDELLPAPNQRYLARRIPRARLVMYEDASHMFFVQKQRSFLRRMKRFLG
jgi:pimeloyl-ACP methyl ester carboxylesterase